MVKDMTGTVTKEHTGQWMPGVFRKLQHWVPAGALAHSSRAGLTFYATPPSRAPGAAQAGVRDGEAPHPMVTGPLTCCWLRKATSALITDRARIRRPYPVLTYGDTAAVGSALIRRSNSLRQ